MCLLSQVCLSYKPMQKPLLTGKKIWVSVRSVARDTNLLPVGNFVFKTTKVNTRLLVLSGVKLVTSSNQKGESPDDTNK